MSEVNLEILKEEILNNFKVHLGSSTWESLTKNDLELIKTCALDAAKLQIKALTSKEDVTLEVKIVNATLLNISVAKYFPIKTLFWESAQRAITIVTSIVIKAAIAAI